MAYWHRALGAWYIVDWYRALGAVEKVVFVDANVDVPGSSPRGPTHIQGVTIFDMY
jgi:hypothetical protein